MKSRGKWWLIALFVLMISVALHSVLRRQQAVPESHPQEPALISLFAPRQRPVSEFNIARELNHVMADAVEKVMPSVVVIRTEKVQFVREIVQLDLFGFVHGYEWVPEQLAGEGSGVIIDESGYIITSFHVIDGAEWIEIVLNDGTKFAADEIGHDQATDLAVLKIRDAERSFPVVEWGDSDALRVGEMVIAIGSPFSLQSSVTVGHVSQKGRRMQALPYEDFIQTDVAINEGNSGGPLIDVDGRLVGINAAILTEAQEKGVGIAFAVPSRLSMVVAKSLIESGVHEWPWVGATFGTYLTAGDSSLRVTGIWRDTPAARAGLQIGDLVIAVDGRPVRDEFDVYRIIFNHSVGESIRLLVQQEDQFEVDLLLEEFPGSIF